MWNNIKTEILILFRNPREIHRVLLVIPLAALMSHVIHLKVSAPKGAPTTDDEIITMILGGVIYAMVTMWAFLSNKLDFDLFMRFFLASVLSVLGHRAIIGAESTGTWYWTMVSLFAITMMMIFVVTGKTKNELKIWFSLQKTEQTNAQTNYPVLGATPDSDEHGISRDYN